MDRIIEELKKYKDMTHVLNTIIDIAYDGIVVVDKLGIITMLNKPYADFLGISAEEAIGKPVTDIIENTRLHLVLKSGKAEIGEVQTIGEHKIVAMRTPIIENSQVIGAIGKIMFKDTSDLNVLANKVNRIEQELMFYKEELNKERSAKYTFELIPEKSPQMLYAKEMAQKAAKGNSSIMILGESGTGKEIFAHSIHNASKRRQGPFIKVNCSAIPAELLESELFGYEEGAFTGARKGGKPGKFHLADGGTLFLDEIGDMPLEMQAKLLRVLSDKEVEKVGGNTPEKVDVRIISATNRNIEKLLEERKFRNDLFYRINVITISLPALRDRAEDLDSLVTIILEGLCKEAVIRRIGVSKEVMKVFREYQWHGNVRELTNVLERAINVIEDKETSIRAEHLPLYIFKDSELVASKSKVSRNLRNILDEREKEAIKEALIYSNGNRSKASKILGISRTSLYEKMEKHSITS